MQIYLRPIKEEDGKLITKWRNNPEVAKHCFNRIPITEESNREFYRTHVLTGLYKQYIVERVNEEFGVLSYPIASVYLKDMDTTNHRCELCIFTSDDEEWNTESQSMAVKMLLNKAFNEYGINKVYSYVFKKYEDEKKLLENAGFQEEALLKREAIGIDGDYEDVYRMSIFNRSVTESVL